MHTSQLTLHHVTKRYPGRTVLDQVSFTPKPGEKAGLIGDNRAGKSTLLRLIAGQERPDSGESTVTAVGGIDYLPQALPLPPTATVQDAVDLALADLRALEAELRRAEQALDDGANPAALAAYAMLLERYEARGGYDADHRVDIALHHLGLPALPRERLLGILSGGERSRLALAGVLADRPELPGGRQRRSVRWRFAATGLLVRVTGGLIPMPLARAMARPASSGLHRLTAPEESSRPGPGVRGAVMEAGGWVGHDGGLALDRLAGAELEVGPVQFVLDGLVILLGPAPQRPKRDALGAGPGGGGRSNSFPVLSAGAEVLTGHIGRGVPGIPGTGVFRQGGAVIPQRPTLRTADEKVTAAGRPDAVGV